MRTPAVFHVVPRREGLDEATAARCTRAFDSWNWLYQAGGVVPKHCWKFVRSAREIGADRELPYLKDVLRAGLDAATDPLDVVLFTNDDVVLHPMILGEIVRFMSFYQAGSMRRVEIDTRDGSIALPPLYNPPLVFMELGMPHVGRDAFVFHAGWLKHYWSFIPDFILGAWGWDICVAALIRLLRGHKIKVVTEFYDSLIDCELPDGLVIHEKHDSKWQEGEQWHTKPANAYNKKLFEALKTRFWPSLDMDGLVDHPWPPSVLIRCHQYLVSKRSYTGRIESLAKEL